MNVREFSEQNKWYIGRIWYIILLIFSSLYVFRKFEEIYSLNAFNLGHLIFIVWLALLLLPLFSEIEFWGVRFKKELEKTKTEIKETINDIEYKLIDIKSILYSSNSIANHININNAPLPPEEKIGELNKKVEEMRANYQQSGTPISNDSFSIPEQSVYLFKVRASIENELYGLCEKTGYDGPKTIFRMLRHLGQCEIIYGTTADLIQQISKITSRGVHGEIISNEYISFVETAYPQVIIELKKAYTELRYCICPRCKYSGPARFDNVCPKCGFTHDDD